MTDRTTTHDTFTIERTFDAPPDRVFQALASPEQKARWFVGPQGWKQVERTHDFRVGGREHVHGRFEATGMTSIFDAVYQDIVPNQRIVYTYTMTVNGRRISVSVATFELLAAGGKTKLVLTEQGAYFEDPGAASYAPEGQAASRRAGTEGLLDQLVRFVADAPRAA